MFFKGIVNFLTCLTLILVFPSCVKYYELSNKECYQGKSMPDRKEVSKNNLKKLTINDQFSTMAIFDCLWLSDDVRNAYIEMNCSRKGKDEQAKMALLTRQLEENKHWITFYILADIRDKTDGSLSDKNSPWGLFLETPDNRRVAPLSIKEIEIEPEYKFLFGPRFNLFGRTYEVKFPAADLSGVKYLKNQSEIFKLVAASPKKEGAVWWNKLDSTETELVKKGKKRKILKNEDYYWIGSQGV
jgi:hypothetical protein